MQNGGNPYARVRKLALSALDVPGRLPRHALLRMLMLAAAATALIVPLSVAVLWALGVESMAFAPFVAFKIVYGAAVGSLTAPLVVRAALSD